MTTSHVPHNPEKAAAWESEWEQRFSPHYRARGDGGLFPRPKVKPSPLNEPGAGREPHSASVIRALELQINGRVLSPPKEPSP